MNDMEVMTKEKNVKYSLEIGETHTELVVGLEETKQ